MQQFLTCSRLVRAVLLDSFLILLWLLISLLSSYLYLNSISVSSIAEIDYVRYNVVTPTWPVSQKSCAASATANIDILPALKGLSLPTLFADQIAFETGIQIIPSFPEGLPSRLAIVSAGQESAQPGHFAPEPMHCHVDQVDLA